MESPRLLPCRRRRVEPGQRSDTETFEGVWPAGLWAAVDNNGALGGQVFWDDDDYKPHSGIWSAWAANGGANGLDPATSFYPANMDSWMVYGPFDLTGYSAAKFEFWYWNQSEQGYDFLSWGASHDDIDYGVSSTSGDSAGWVFRSFDLERVPG